MDERKESLNRGNAGKGRPKGSPNKTTTALKEAILQAATESGGPEGMVGYLKTLAADQPVAFAGLLGKVLPMTVAGDAANPIRTVSEIVLVDGTR